MAYRAGGVAPGERLEAALKREVREETGIEVEVGEMLFFKEDFFYYDPGDRAYHSCNLVGDSCSGGCRFIWILLNWDFDSGIDIFITLSAEIEMVEKDFC